MGEVVLCLNGRLVSTKELGRLIEQANADPSHSFVDTLTIYEDAHLVLPPGTLIHFGNHSCDPNMWHVGPYEIATRPRCWRRRRTDHRLRHSVGRRWVLNGL